MKKLFILFLLFLHIFFTNASASLRNKLLNFFSYKVSSGETIPDLPLELWLKIGHDLNRKDQSHLALVGHKFDQYSLELHKARCKKIGKKDAEETLVNLGFFQPFYKKFTLNDRSEKYAIINNKKLAEVLLKSYTDYFHKNYISACIQYSEIFLPQREDSLCTQISEKSVEYFGEMKEEKFEFNINEIQESVSLKVFFYQNQPSVLILSTVPTFAALDHFAEFLKQLVAKYDNVQRIIIDRYLIQNPESFFDYFEAICKILGDREIVIQNKYGLTPLHWFFKNLQLDQIKQKLDPIFKKYQKYIEKNLNMRNKSGALPLMSVIFQDPLINYAELLLEKYQANTHAFDIKGKTVLHYVTCFQACENKTEKIKMLIKHGANVNDKDGFGKTPLEYCTDNSEGVICAKILLENGAIFPENPSEQMIKLEKKIFPILSTLKDFILSFSGSDNKFLKTS